MTDKQLHILRHSIGLDDSGQGREYRNHFVTGPGTTDFEDCIILVESGMMKDHFMRPDLYGNGNHCFTVTEKGIGFVRSMKSGSGLSPSQERYRAWLRLDCGLSFGDYLRSKRRIETTGALP